jgi:hypothetical protein
MMTLKRRLMLMLLLVHGVTVRIGTNWSMQVIRAAAVVIR